MSVLCTGWSATLSILADMTSRRPPWTAAKSSNTAWITESAARAHHASQHANRPLSINEFFSFLVVSGPMSLSTWPGAPGFHGGLRPCFSGCYFVCLVIFDSCGSWSCCFILLTLLTCNRLRPVALLVLRRTDRIILTKRQP